MKGKQLAIVLVLLLAFGGVALLLSRRNADSWSNTATAAGGRILNFPLNDVSHLTIKDGNAELNLIKKEDVWRVRERADYPANFDLIGDLMRKLWELRPVQELKIGASQLARLQLVEPGASSSSGTFVDLKGEGDKRFAGVLLGKKQLRNPDQPERAGIAAGRYVKADNSNRVFLIAETFDAVDPKPERWLNRDFIKIENVKSITMAGATPAMNWKLTREASSAPWKLLDAKLGEELDATKASSLENIFANAGFADVLAPDAKTAETGLDKPATVTYETFDNFVYVLRIGKLAGENYPVLVSIKAELPESRTPAKDEKAEDKTRLDQEFQAHHKQLADKLAKEQTLENRPYLIPKFTIDQLLKDRSTLLVEKKPSPTPAEAKPRSKPKSR
jgi:Domain of unknown function (DUF4340)